MHIAELVRVEAGPMPHRGAGRILGLLARPPRARKGLLFREGSSGNHRLIGSDGSSLIAIKEPPEEGSLKCHCSRHRVWKELHPLHCKCNLP